MPNDTIIADMKIQDPDKINEADFPMLVDPIHKILYCEVQFIFIFQWNSKIHKKLCFILFREIIEFFWAFYAKKLTDF